MLKDDYVKSQLLERINLDNNISIFQLNIPHRKPAVAVVSGKKNRNFLCMCLK